MVKIFNNSGNETPHEATNGSVGFDLRANETVTVSPKQRVIIKTGIHIQMPETMFASIRPKSGISTKTPLLVIEGTIDSDYTGEIGVIVHNYSEEFYTVEKGIKIAQLIFEHAIIPYIAEVMGLSEFEETERGSNGFGSTGK